MSSDSQKLVPSPPRRVAIVGGGISGIACSWELRKHNCTVDIYEADSRLGGHAHSVTFEGDQQRVDVDTGFIAMEEATYPRFNSFLEELGVKTIPTDMSFGVSTADGAFEWGSYSISSFVGKVSHLLSPWFWRLVFDVVRFSLFAQDILDEDQEALYSATSYKKCSNKEKHILGDDHPMTADLFESIGAYLRRQRYSDQFITYYLIPMVAAPWCIDPDEFARSFPAKSLIQFMLDHGLLDTVIKTLRWRSFRNGSKTYVDAFQRSLPPRHQLHLSTPVQKVTRAEGGTILEFSKHPQKTYDHVVLAVNANQALHLLGDEATSLERKILSCFKTSKNICYLHSDTSFLPKRPSARVAWNCFLGRSNDGTSTLTKHTTLQKAPFEKERSSPSHSSICLTFDMNKLQSIPFPGEPGSPGRVLVSMNPLRIPRSLQSSHVYHHPLISAESIHMAARLHTINGVAGVTFAGAWMGFGFHEDGFVAGTQAARVLMMGGEGWRGHDDTRTLDVVGAGTMAKNKYTRRGFVKPVVRLWIRLVQLLLLIFEDIIAMMG
ncbi:Protoporphyrinogen oxidase 2, chloroplastic/mitochondrial [Cytospora mali]|uniref:Protoporphyrinogen oxidase 2, chloroplastic/mitochondrial n=1 Tax=Cytospora mali TaxID=578113 RepID=A0A194VAN3_CYTMA|nr:Protoporphyrinogen oxidase 2, chloroplastic/mitochondrial [Valsa mali var. pyri (nom. inval.)]